MHGNRLLPGAGATFMAPGNSWHTGQILDSRFRENDVEGNGNSNAPISLFIRVAHGRATRDLNFFILAGWCYEPGRMEPVKPAGAEPQRSLF